MLQLIVKGIKFALIVEIEKNNKGGEMEEYTHEQYINTMVLLTNMTFEEAEQALKNYVSKGEI